MKNIFSLFLVLVSVSAWGQGVGQGFTPSLGANAGAVDSTRLVQDTVLQYWQDGVVVRSDTVRVPSVGGSGTSDWGSITNVPDTIVYQSEIDFIGVYIDSLLRLDSLKKQYFLLASGQSNMYGSGTAVGCVTDTVSGVFVCVGSTPQVAVRGQAPFNPTGANNLALEFAIRLYEATGAEVYIVANFQSGNPISNWDDGNVRWNELIARTVAAGVEKYDAVLWQQGEADFDETVEYYSGKWYDFVDRLRAEVFVDASTPIIAGELVEGAQDLQNDFFRTLNTDLDPFTKFASGEGLTNVGDALHYDCESLKKLGRERFWGAFLSAGTAETQEPERISLTATPYLLDKANDYSVFINTGTTVNDTIYFEETNYKEGWSTLIKANGGDDIVLKSEGANFVTDVAVGDIEPLPSGGSSYIIFYDGTRLNIIQGLSGLQQVSEYGQSTTLKLDLLNGVDIGTTNPINIEANEINFNRPSNLSYITQRGDNGKIRVRMWNDGSVVNVVDFTETGAEFLQDIDMKGFTLNDLRDLLVEDMLTVSNGSFPITIQDNRIQFNRENLSYLEQMGDNGTIRVRMWNNGSPINNWDWNETENISYLGLNMSGNEVSNADDATTPTGLTTQQQVDAKIAARILAGGGSPEGNVIAPPGTLYVNLAGGTSSTLYVKETGTGSTGWVAK